MKKSIFSQNSSYWTCAFDFKQYEEFLNYQKENKPYLTYYNLFFHNNNDILFLFCRSVPKKIKGGIFGYCILENESQVNNLKVKVFKDELVNRCYSKIKEIKLIKDPYKFLTLEELFDCGFNNITTKSFSVKYLKKYLLMINVPLETGDYIKEQFEKKYVEYQKSIKPTKPNIVESEEDEESIDDESDEDDKSDEDDESDTDDSDTDDNDEETEDSDETNKKVDTFENNDDEENNKNGLIPIMVELCKKFEFPTVKYDKKQYTNNNNPDITEKCKYFKKHIVKCEKCNIVNNNKSELSYLLQNAKVWFKEFKYTDPELDESIDKYQSCSNFDGFGYDVDEINIKLNYITDDDNIYNNCILLYITKPPI
jgi:hypothetical protein